MLDEDTLFIFMSKGKDEDPELKFVKTSVV